MAVKKYKTKPKAVEEILPVCYKCGRTQKNLMFYKSKNPFNVYFENRMPWCSECLYEKYNELYYRYQNHSTVMEEICKIINVPYENEIFEIARRRLENEGKEILGSYMQYLSGTAGNKFGLYYTDSTKFRIVENKSIDIELDDEFDEEEILIQGDIGKDLSFFWGRGFTNDEYEFLEWNLEEWKKTSKCDTRSELTCLKEIAITQLELRNARENNATQKEILDITKALQELMKTAAIDPAKANIASAGRMQETFGSWIKEIEQKKPAEWHNDQKKYKDMDGFTDYIQKFIVRPIKNFITGSRDFNIEIDGEFMGIKSEEDVVDV